MSHEGSWPPPPARPPSDGRPAGRPSDDPVFEQPAFVHLPSDEPDNPYAAVEPPWPEPTARGWGDPGGERGAGSYGRRSAYGEDAPVRRSVGRPGADRPRSDEPAGRGAPATVRRSRVRIVALGVVVAGVVATVVLRQAIGGDDTTSAHGTGWEEPRFGDSQLLAGDGEQVCSVTPDSLVFCLDGETGEELLSHQLYLSVVTSPVLAGEHLLVAGSSAGAGGSMLAVTTGGDELWETPIEVPSDRPMPVVGDVVAVVAGADIAQSTLVGVDAASGAERWRSYGPSGPDAARVVSNNVFTDGQRLYVTIVQPGGDGSGSGHVVAVDPASGQEVWRSPSLPSITITRGVSSMARFDDGSALAFAVGGSPLAGQPSGQVVALDAASGEIRWERASAGPQTSVAHIGGVTVVVDGATMTGVDTAGTELWSTTTPTTDGTEASEGQRLVHEADRLFVVGHDVHQVDPATGESDLVVDSGTTSDVAVAGDHLIVAGVLAVTAVPLDDLPPADHGGAVVTG